MSEANNPATPPAVAPDANAAPAAPATPPAAPAAPAPDANAAPVTPPAVDPAKPADPAKPDDAAPDAKKPTDQLLFEGDKPKDDANPDDPNKPKDGDPAEPVFAKIEELKIPEEYQVPEAMKESFNNVAKEHGLNPAQAQALVDLHVEALNKQADAWEDVKAEWRDKVTKDTEIGGDKLKGVATRVNNLIASNTQPEEAAELKTVLQDLGLGNNPVFIKVMNRIAQKLGDDNIGKPSAPSGAAEKTIAQRMYPNMASGA